MTRHDKFYDGGDALFHYTKLSTAIEHILPDKRLKLSRIQDSNDPAESNGMSLGMWGRRPSEFTEKSFGKIYDTVNSPYRVVSFCSNQTPTLVLHKSQQQAEELIDSNNCSKGWEKARMWIQYAECHTGICIVLSKEKLEENLKNIQEIGQYQTGYTKYYYRDNSQINNLSNSKLENDKSGDYAAQYIKNIRFQKHIDYRDEAEFRVIVSDTTVEYIDIKASIKAVIVGVETPKIYETLIQELCTGLKCEFLKVLQDSASCKFHLLPVSGMIKFKKNG